MARPTRAAAPAAPNWAAAQEGVDLGYGSAPRFGEIDQSLSFGGAMPQYPTSSPLSFGSSAAPMVYSGRGSYGMPAAPSQMPYRPDLPWGDQAYFYGSFMNTGLPPTEANAAMQNYWGYGIPRSR